MLPIVFGENGGFIDDLREVVWDTNPGTGYPAASNGIVDMGVRGSND